MMYDADYYLNGKKSGKSLYEDYRWLPELTIPMTQAIVKHLDIHKGHSILDYGAARGYTVKAFRQLGYNCHGIDISEWAVANCDPEVADCMQCTATIPFADWIIAKDVLEHIKNAADIAAEMTVQANYGIFVVVPLAPVNGGLYVVPSYEKDITHIHRLTLATWASFFMQPGWTVTASYRVPGIKDNYAQYSWGNGFITARRVCEQ